MRLTSRLSRTLDRLATGRRAAIALAASAVFLVPYMTLVFADLTARGPLLDQQLTFSPAEFHAVLAGYGTVLRGHYLRAEIVDLAIAPVCFAIALAISAGLRAAGRDSRLALVPVVAGILNDVKALCFIGSISTFPRESEALVWIASGINTAKSLAMAASLVLLLIALAMAALAAMRTPRGAVTRVQRK